MACNLLNLSGSGRCRSADGGIYETFLAECDDIADVIYDNDGCITNFVMTSLGKWVRYEFDVDDDTAYYNQEGDRNNNKHTVNQTSFFKFGGVTKTMVNFGNGIKDCCCLVAVHFFNSGISLVQGIDRDPVTGTWRKSKKYLKATVNILSDTGQNEDRTEITLNSTGRCFSSATTLTSANLQAL